MPNRFVGDYVCIIPNYLEQSCFISQSEKKSQKHALYSTDIVFKLTDSLIHFFPKFLLILITFYK